MFNRTFVASYQFPKMLKALETGMEYLSWVLADGFMITDALREEEGLCPGGAMPVGIGTLLGAGGPLESVTVAVCTIYCISFI